MKVSVIIPTYNRAELVCESIDSVLAQSYNDYEIIVVNDGSTDNTASKLKKYGNKIRYYEQANGGVNKARNFALSKARGEYIATLDNDDLWQHNKLDLQVKILNNFPEIAFTFSNFSIYKSQNNIQPDGIQTWYSSPKSWNDFYEKSIKLNEFTNEDSTSNTGSASLFIGNIYQASLQTYYVLPSTALFRRNMIPEDVKFVEHDSICGDWDFFARLSRDNKVAYLDYDTTYNRSHEDDVRLTRTNWKKQLELRIDFIERLYLQDKEFYENNKYITDLTYSKRLKALYRQQLLDGERHAAKTTLQKYHSHTAEPGISYTFLWLLCHVPAIQYPLSALRHLRGSMRNN
ncbi:MAG: glycosyltransferase family 2 protein [Gammaproteobacteria bacterium]|nr:glycosyltransferase family 2 protein [Gammaproteobacteria bacterium]